MSALQEMAVTFVEAQGECSTAAREEGPNRVPGARAPQCHEAPPPESLCSGSLLIPASTASPVGAGRGGAMQAGASWAHLRSTRRWPAWGLVPAEQEDRLLSLTLSTSGFCRAWAHLALSSGPVEYLASNYPLLTADGI